MQLISIFSIHSHISVKILLVWKVIHIFFLHWCTYLSDDNIFIFAHVHYFTTFTLENERDVISETIVS